MPSEPAAIVAADAVTAPWITEVFRRAGVTDGNEVVEVRGASIGTGQVGDNVRFELTWAEDDPTLPATVVGKFPSPSDVSRNAARLTGTYLRETGFYRDLVDEVEIRVPTCWHVAYDEASNDFTLILADQAPAVQGDQLAGTTLEVAQRVVAEAAGLHAPTWGRAKELAKLSWLDEPSEGSAADKAAFYRWALEGFTERYRDRLDDHELGLGERLGARLGRLWEVQDDGHLPYCIAHDDYRLDNLLLDEEAGTVTVVDWQTARLGFGPSDIAYFCGAGLLPDDRARHEEELVLRYVGALRDRGVEVADDLVWDRYVLGSAGGYVMAVIASQIVEQTERGDDMFVTMASRHAAQIDHLGLLSRLGG